MEKSGFFLPAGIDYFSVYIQVIRLPKTTAAVKGCIVGRCRRANMTTWRQSEVNMYTTYILVRAYLLDRVTAFLCTAFHVRISTYSCVHTRRAVCFPLLFLYLHVCEGPRGSIDHPSLNDQTIAQSGRAERNSTMTDGQAAGNRQSLGVSS